MSVADAALRCAEAGWFVLPVSPESHDPASLLGPKWGGESSVDPRLIERWFEAWPSAALALDLGRSSAVAFAFRSDAPQLTSRRLKIATDGVTVRHQRSPRGQWHLFQLEEGVTLPSGEYGPLEGYGEVLCEGKIAVVAPARVVGDRSVPLWSPEPLEFLPADILAELQAGVDKQGTTVSELDKHGFTLADAKPLHEQATQEPATAPAPNALLQRSSWAPVDMREVLWGAIDPVVPSLMPRDDGNCLLYPGKIHSFFGEPESWKSLLLQWASVETMWDGGDVLYIDLESDGASVVRRLRSLGATERVLTRRFSYVRPDVDVSATKDQAAWKALLNGDFALVVIDGVTEALDLFGYQSTDNDDVAHWMRTVPRQIAHRTGAAVALVDHVTKSREGRARFPIGAQAKLSAITGAAYLVEARTPLSPARPGQFDLRLAKDREGAIRAFAGADGGRTPLVARGVVTLARTPESEGADRISVVLRPPDTTTEEAHGVEGEGKGIHRGPEPRDAALVVETVSKNPGLTQSELLTRLRGSRTATTALVNTLEASKILRTESGPRNSKRYFVS